ncbi:hypothetical protein NPIL_169271 [Nephila pilipes]|uniref:Uncharacterized protein n=1 Tax=Nephila pilipes TaxID=299642 RepID=A0A8X6Q2U3_NEPPI|nr:hypothetical protein NPIL_169271 [Nephila pilipes]
MNLRRLKLYFDCVIANVVHYCRDPEQSFVAYKTNCLNHEPKSIAEPNDRPERRRTASSALQVDRSPTTHMIAGLCCNVFHLFILLQ